MSAIARTSATEMLPNNLVTMKTFLSRCPLYLERAPESRPSFRESEDPALKHANTNYQPLCGQAESTNHVAGQRCPWYGAALPTSTRDGRRSRGETRRRACGGDRSRGRGSARRRGGVAAGSRPGSVGYGEGRRGAGGRRARLPGARSRRGWVGGDAGGGGPVPRPRRRTEDVLEQAEHRRGAGWSGRRPLDPAQRARGHGGWRGPRRLELRPVLRRDRGRPPPWPRLVRHEGWAGHLNRS